MLRYLFPALMVALLLSGCGTSTEPVTPPLPAEPPAVSVTPETPADGEQSASTEAPAESEAQPAQGGETGGESPAISMPSQEQLEQAASSLQQAASTVLDALFGSSSSSEATDTNEAA